MTAVRPPSRFGNITIKDGQVTRFLEKPVLGEGKTGTDWINGGFFVFNAAVFDYLSGDQTILEREPMENLARDGQLAAYTHEGFWQCMDTMRDKLLLDSLLENDEPPWLRVGSGGSPPCWRRCN